ncbi:hypothetical protein [Mycolicibacterium tusciae]|uniref:hypothetical protein n=1 Tax=Mycolicibacterium tusciae TaxID=75922 RepID=UPI00024A2341|nr:hypothetical protein [Mycolicibacterium tusciae]
MAKRGILTQADAVVAKLADGTPTNQLWMEFQDVLSTWNERRTRLTDLLTFSTTAAADPVVQGFGGSKFEGATEYGVPRAVGTPTAALMGYTFRDHDLASRLTWRAMRSMTAEQVRAQFAEALDADSRLTTGTVLQRIMTPTQGISPEGNPVYGLWNSDGMVPNPYLGTVFPGSTSHYVATENATLDSADVEDGINMLRAKGFGVGAGSQILIIAGPSESEAIQTWRAGEPSRSSGPDAKFDFLPSSSAPPFIRQGTLIGSAAPNDYEGLPILGSYGHGWLHECPIMPAKYVLLVATSGANANNNVCGFREHPASEWQGLKQLPGNWSTYPLVESFWTRSFGVGVRNRGAAVALHCVADDEYVAPTFDQ